MTDIWFDLLHARADVTFAVGWVLAVIVTIHILLRKREVAAAVGWMGLVWFAPILGAITYLVFGINRVKRRARRLRPGDNGVASPSTLPLAASDRPLDVLARGIDRITRRPLLPGTAVKAYENGDEAYPVMLAAIADATASIGMSSYIFNDDVWGGRFIDALQAAQMRGVAVRVMVDGIGGGWLLSRAYHRLRRQGLPAARFMHSLLPWRMPFLNLRNHKKILVIDGVLGFTGGMNIADENVVAMHPPTPVRDLHFRIEGPVVAQLVAVFAEDWNFESDEELDGAAWFPDITPGPGVSARVIDAGPDEDLEKIEYAVLQAVTCARTSISVMTPYFLPDDRLTTALSLAAMRGVAVDVVLPERSDHVLVNWAARANVGSLLSDGVRMWWSPEPFHHAKILVVDGEWCLIGSSNWDIRSFRLNFELCMETYDGELAETLTAFMRRSRGRALTEAELDARSLPVRIRDAGARLLLPYL